MTPDLAELKKHPKVLELYRSRLKLRQEGRRWRGLCPFHADTNANNFDIFQTDGILIYKCLSCNATGDIFSLIQKTDNIPFKDSVAVVRNFTSDWSNKRNEIEETFPNVGQEAALKTFPEEDYRKYEEALNNNEAARSYLESERGIGYETARKLRVGYRQDVGRLAGRDNGDVSANGWLAFPTFGNSVCNTVVTSIKFRSIAKKAFTKMAGMATNLFNLETVDFLEPIFVAEGELDVLTFEQAGFRCVGLSNATTSPSAEEKDKLMQAECVILAGDNDEAGTKIMAKLWAELKERTYLLKWPAGIKDANQFFLENCKRDISVFRTKINQLVAAARSEPMAGVVSLQEAMMNHGQENVVDDPDRFRFPWKSVDGMALLAKGSLIGVVATSTGMGKSTWVIQATLEAARQHGEVVLNYQAELTHEQVARIVAAQVLRKHRLQLTKEDFTKAAEKLTGVKYYIGRNPTLTTIGPVIDLLEMAVRRLSPSCLVIDNIHYLARFEADQVKATENAMQRLKNMSAQYGLKTFVVGQPKKADAKSKGKTLHISDVRGSASFGDDSDAVFTIHRDIINNRDDDKKNDYSPQTKIRLVKVRDKGPGDAEVELVFLGEMATFAEPSYAEPPAQGHLTI